jgi:hypothetical protein
MKLRLCLLLLTFAATAANAAEAVFEQIDLEFMDRALDRATVDVDGDGLLDLAWIFHPVDDKENFGLRTCLQGSKPRFSACSDFDLPDAVRAFDIAPLDATPGAELVLLTQSGALRSSFQGGRFGEATTIPGVYSALADTDSRIPGALRFLFDLDRDGRYEAVLATRRGVDVHSFHPDGTPSTQKLASPAHVEIARHRREMDLSAFLHRDYSPHVTTQTTTPAVFVEDMNGDGRVEIATISQNRLLIFEQTPGGSFSGSPSADLERSVITEEEEEGGFTGEALTFSDLNGDGLVDLIVLKWGSSEERTQMDRHVFPAGKNWQFAEVADQVIRSESFFPNFEIQDLNGDGRKDLVVPYFHFAPSQAIKAVTQNVLRLQLRLFLMRADGRYTQDAGKSFAKVDRRIVLDYHVDVMGLMFGGGGRPRGFEPLLTTRGDFNGDGLPDLVVDNGSDTLNIYWGNAQAQYAKQPDLALDYESSLDSALADLNGDGRTDVITAYGKQAVGWAETAEPEAYARTKQARKREADRRARGTGNKPSGAETRFKLLLSRPGS